MRFLIFIIVLIPILSFSQKSNTIKLRTDFTDFSEIYLIDENSSRDQIEIEINGTRIRALYIDSSYKAIYDTLYHNVNINQNSFDTIRFIRTYYPYIDSTNSYEERTYTKSSLAKFEKGRKYIMYYNSCCAFSLYPAKTKNVRGVVKFEILNALDKTYMLRVGTDGMSVKKSQTDFKNYYECAMCLGSPNTISVEIDSDGITINNNFIAFNFLHREKLIVTYDQDTKSYTLRIDGYLKKKWDYTLYEK